MDLPQPALEEKYTRLLDAAAHAAKGVTSILDPELLLHRTAGIICKEFGFRHASVFLLDESNQWAVLRTASGLNEIQDCRLAVDGDASVSIAIRQRQVQLVSVGHAAEAHELPYLAETRSAMALPLEIGDEVIGALLVQSSEQTTFLRAGRGEAGKAMIAVGHRLGVGGNSMIGAANRPARGPHRVGRGRRGRLFQKPPPAPHAFRNGLRSRPLITSHFPV